MADAFTTTGDVKFLGDVTIDGTFTVNSGGGDIEIAGNVTSSGSDEFLYLTDGTGSGTITLGGTVTTADITLVGDSGIILSGDLTSNKASAGAFVFTGPITRLVPIFVHSFIVTLMACSERSFVICVV